MAKQRKRADGRLCKTFTFKGKRYYIYGYSKQEVEEKEYAKRKELEKGQERRDNPTMNEYYEAWTENRRGSIKEATLHGQICQFKVCSKVKIGNASRSFGELKIKEVTVEDIRQVQKALLKEGRKTRTTNDAIKEIIQHQKNLNKILHNSDIVQIKDRIFKAREGGLLMATPADRDIKRICKRIGMQYFTMHAFRATFATRLIEQGINPRTVQELLGHADFRITMNLY